MQEILEDPTILKVGGRISGDVKRLKGDYDFNVKGTIHLQYLANECNYLADSVEQMTKTHLNIDISPLDWRLQLTDWRRKQLLSVDTNYAAKTVHVLIELFKVFEDKLLKEKCSGDWKQFIELCSPYLNEEYPKQESTVATNGEEIVQFGTLPEPTIRVASTVEECRNVIDELRR